MLLTAQCLAKLHLHQYLHASNNWSACFVYSTINIKHSNFWDSKFKQGNCKLRVQFHDNDNNYFKFNLFFNWKTYQGNIIIVKLCCILTIHFTILFFLITLFICYRFIFKNTVFVEKVFKSKVKFIKVLKSNKNHLTFMSKLFHVVKFITSV